MWCCVEEKLGVQEIRGAIVRVETPAAGLLEAAGLFSS